MLQPCLYSASRCLAPWGEKAPRSSVAKAQWSWARAGIATGLAFVLHRELVSLGRHMTAVVVDDGTCISRNLGRESRSGAVTEHVSSIPAWFSKRPRISCDGSVRGRQAAAPCLGPFRLCEGVRAVLGEGARL